MTTTITSINAQPVKITIETLSYKTFEINAEYEDPRLNIREVISFNSGGGIKYRDIMMLMNAYTKPRQLDLTTGE